MSWFGPKLEAGERMLLRRPEPSSDFEVILGLLFALLCWGGSYMFIDWISPNGIEPSGYIISLLLPVFVLGRMYQGRTWSVVVTDRRLMVQWGWVWQKPLVATLDEVESISIDHAAYRIRIRAGGREIAVHGESFDVTEVNEAIERARAGVA